MAHYEPLSHPMGRKFVNCLACKRQKDSELSTAMAPPSTTILVRCNESVACS